LGLRHFHIVTDSSFTVVMSFLLSAHVSAAVTGWISMKFGFSWISVEKPQIWLKLGKNRSNLHEDVSICYFLLAKLNHHNNTLFNSHIIRLLRYTLEVWTLCRCASVTLYIQCPSFSFLLLNKEIHNIMQCYSQWIYLSIYLGFCCNIQLYSIA
jgi:hypothetical protein